MTSFVSPFRRLWTSLDPDSLMTSVEDRTAPNLRAIISQAIRIAWRDFESHVSLLLVLRTWQWRGTEIENVSLDLR